MWSRPSRLSPKLPAYMPHPILFVMLGEIGLILLVIEAGTDIDLTTLKLIGSRGLIITVTRSILLILLAFLMVLAIGTDFIRFLAAGACFGPTNLGIIMNILCQCKIVNTPAGQLIVSTVVIGRVGLLTAGAGGRRPQDHGERGV